MKHKTAIEEVNRISTLFLDIGGVLLSDGWGYGSRQEAANLFKLDHQDMEKRHRLNFETFELGKMSLDDYLNRVVFYRKRSFTPEAFRKFMFNQSKPFPEMMEMVIRLKRKYGLRIIVVSNEGLELNEWRIKQFKLSEFVDFFASSCFLHLLKPDMDIFRFALKGAQVDAKNIIYIENQLLFIQLARDLGINGICHTDYQTTLKELEGFGLSISD